MITGNKQKWFLDYDSEASFDEINRRFSGYQEYLTSLIGILPPKTHSFATAAWHYNTRDPRCPHDSRLQSLSISDIRNTQDAEMITKIDLVLLASHRDRRICISYEGVEYYMLDKSPLINEQNTLFGGKANFHGDWLIDEIAWLKEDLIAHRIVFSNEVQWIIYCKDIEYSWILF